MMFDAMSNKSTGWVCFGGACLLGWYRYQLGKQLYRLSGLVQVPAWREG
jgi:hypothetical protein